MKSSVSILLAFLLLFSTVGMAKTTHWCMGHEMESVVAFGEKHIDCGMEMTSEQKDPTDATADPGSCCKNTTEHVQVDDEFQLSSLDHSIDLPFVYSLITTFIFNASFFTSPVGDIPNYSSPPPQQDLQLLHEAFLI